MHLHRRTCGKSTFVCSYIVVKELVDSVEALEVLEEGDAADLIREQLLFKNVFVTICNGFSAFKTATSRKRKLDEEKNAKNHKKTNNNFSYHTTWKILLNVYKTQ